MRPEPSTVYTTSVRSPGRAGAAKVHRTLTAASLSASTSMLSHRCHPSAAAQTALFRAKPQPRSFSVGARQ